MDVPSLKNLKRQPPSGNTECRRPVSRWSGANARCERQSRAASSKTFVENESQNQLDPVSRLASDGGNLRLILIKLHLYLGLVAGALLCVIALTGALYAYEPQLRAWWGEPVTPATLEGLLSPSEVTQKIRAIGQAGKLSALRWPEEPTLPLWVIWKDPDGARRDFMVDPVTGAELPRAEQARAFLHGVLEVHRTLTLGPTGSIIVGVAAFCLLTLTLTGLCIGVRRWRDAPRLWFAVRSERKSRSPRIRWRFWHRLVGAWATPWLLLMPLTGMVWSFEAYGNLIKSLGGPPRFDAAPPAVAGDFSSPSPLDAIWRRCLETGAGPLRMRLMLPDQPGLPVRFEWSPPEVPSHAMRSRLFLDSSTGAAIETQRWEDFSSGEQLVRWAFPLHTGRVFGIVGQTIAFVGSLTIPFFFVSGLYLYAKRRRQGVAVPVGAKSLQSCKQIESTR